MPILNYYYYYYYQIQSKTEAHASCTLAITDGT
jgi:hypothetical protein